MPKLRRERCPDARCGERVSYFMPVEPDGPEVMVGSVWIGCRAKCYSANCTHPHFGRFVGDNYATREDAEKALVRQLSQYRVLDRAYDPATKTGVFLDGRGNVLPDGVPPVYLTFRLASTAKNSRGDRYDPQPNREEITL